MILNPDWALALPEIIALENIVEHNDWHDDDVLQQSLRLREWVMELAANLTWLTPQAKHSLEILLRAPVAPGPRCETVQELLAFAALIHDVGKAAIFERSANGTTQCPGHEAIGGAMAATTCSRFDFTPTEAHFIIALVRHHGAPYTLYKQVAVLPREEREERVRRFEVEHSDHLLPLLLLATGDLVTSQLQIYHLDKYNGVLDFYRRWLERAARKRVLGPARGADRC